MAAEQIHGTFRIVSGAAKAAFGRLLSDGALAATGRMEQIAGEAALACAKARRSSMLSSRA